MGRELFTIVCLILLNGAFAGAEIALLSIRSTRVRDLVEKGTRRAEAVEALRRTPERLLATVQIGITVIGVAAAAFAGEALARRLATILRTLGMERSADGVAFAVVVAIVSFLSLVFGELVPKSLALRSTERFALLVAPTLLRISRITAPLVWLLTATSNLVLRVFKDETTFTEGRISAEEVRQLIEEVTDAGELDPHTGDIATRAIDFRELRIDAVMVPRPAIVVLYTSYDREEVLRALDGTPHSRFPVCGSDLDDVRGYVRARDVYRQLLQDRPLDLEALLRPVPYFPASKPAVEVLRELQQLRQLLGVIVDEQGGVAGLVTIEDLVEELVGEIFGEGDRSETSIRKESDGSVVVSGLTPVRDVNRELDLELPDGPGHTTVGGLVLSLTGRLPERGEEVAPDDETLLRVEQVSPRRVVSVRIRRQPHGEGPVASRGGP